MPRTKPPPSCQPAKLIVGEVAAKLGISTRHLIRLANGGIPGLKRAPNGRNFDWREVPKTMKWLRNEERIRNGGEKRPAKRKARLSKAQRFARVIARVEKQVFSHLKPALEKPTNSELEKLGKAARRLKSICDSVNTKILLSRSGWTGH